MSGVFNSQIVVFIDQGWTYIQLIQPLGQTRCELNVTHVAFNVLTHCEVNGQKIIVIPISVTAWDNQEINK